MGSTVAQPARTRTRWVPDAPFDSAFGMFRHISIGGLSGLTAGFLVAGVGGRLFMRIAGAAAGERGSGMRTEAGFTVGEITLEGTVGLVIFIGIFAGVIGAAVYLAFRPWLAWAGRWRGVVFGVVLFGFGSATSDMMNPDNIDFLILRNSELLIALIFGLFLAFGVVTDAVFAYLDGRMPDEQDRSKTTLGVYVVLSIVGLLIFVAPGSAAVGGGELCDCESPVRASVSFGAVAVATVVFWFHSILDRPLAWMVKSASVLGYLGTVGVVVFGMIRALSDAADIIG